MAVCDLTRKDATSLMSLDKGERLDYFDTVRALWSSEKNAPILASRLDRVVGNWYVFIIQSHHLVLTSCL